MTGCISLVKNFEEIDSKTAARLVGVKESGKLTTRQLDQLAEAVERGELSGDELRRISNLLVESQKYRVGDEVTVEDLLLIKTRRGDLSQTRLAVVRDDDTVWLERGQTRAEANSIGRNPTGWQHILEDHRNDFLKNPDLGTDSNEEIMELVETTIQQGERYEIPDDRGDMAFVHTHNGQEVTVIVGGNGYVVTSYPGLPKNINV